MDSAFFVKSLGALFAIMNPFMALPMFLSLTAGYDGAARRRTALAVIGFSAAMCLLVGVAGIGVLSVFGISVDDFRVAGGIVLMMIALGMLNGNGMAAHTGSQAERADHVDLETVAFYPMTFPMIIGPGTITTLVIFTGRATGPAQVGALVLAVTAVLAATAVVLLAADRIGHVMSQRLRVIMTRLMGMILAAVAVDMVATGLRALLPGLG